jgi:hypothetical protein
MRNLEVLKHLKYSVGRVLARMGPIKHIKLK